MKKILASFMTLALVLTMASGITHKASAEQEPVTITVGSATAFADGFWDWDVTQIIEKALNVKFKYTFYDADKFSLMLASGDLPDIVVCKQPYLDSVLDNGLSINFDKYTDDKSFINSEQFKARNEVMRTLLGGKDHGLYFIAPGLGPERTGAGKLGSRGYAVRWDYYKELGCPPIENDEDYLNVLRQMCEKHPTTLDGSPTYAIGLYNTLESFYMRASYLRNPGLNPWTCSGYLYMATWDDCILQDGYIDPEHSAFWTDLKFYNNVYRAGLFDMDNFTQTTDEYNAKLKAGVYVGEVYTYNTMYAEMQLADKDTMAGMVIIPSSGAYVHANKLNIIGNAPTDTIFVSSSSKNIEKCVEIINYMHDPAYIRTVYSGVQGVHWDYDASGKPYLFDETIALRSGNGDEWQKTGFGRSTVAMWNMAQPVTLSAADNYPYELMEMAEYRGRGIGTMYEDYCKHYNATYPGEALYNGVLAGVTKDLSGDYAQTVSAGMTSIPLDIKRIMDACNDILYRNMAKLVMCTSDEEFAALRDSLIQEMKNAGEETAWEWYSTNFNAVRESLQPAVQTARDVFEKNYLGTSH